MHARVRVPVIRHLGPNNDRNQVMAPMTESGCCHGGRPFNESMKEMILTRDSGMLLRPERSFVVFGGRHTIE